MPDLNQSFRKRIGYPVSTVLSFDHLESILNKTAKAIPFENTRIMTNQIQPITEEYLVDKICYRNEGGLCYELNPLLYLFLKENGFNVTLIRALIFNEMNNQWNPLGDTHVAILLEHQQQLFLLDTGFGGNLPLAPVPLSDIIVQTETGDFKISNTITPYGEYIFELKLKHKDSAWRTGYSFSTKNIIESFAELNGVQTTIQNHPKSPFNKRRLLSKITDTGTVTLTDTSFTEWINGMEKKVKIDQQEFRELVGRYFDQ